MSDEQGDQTEAELERTRQVVAASMAEQIAVNDAAMTGAEFILDEPDEPVEAPRRNAGRAEWAAYAEAQGYEIDDEWGRDDIRELFAEED